MRSIETRSQQSELSGQTDYVDKNFVFTYWLGMKHLTRLRVFLLLGGDCTRAKSEEIGCCTEVDLIVLNDAV